MVRTPTRLLLLNLSMNLMIACGGSGSTTPVTLPSPPLQGSTASLAAVQGLLDTHADPVDYTALSTIPQSGNANYSGFAYGTLANTSDAITDSLIGELSLSVSFSPSTTSLTGNITDFVDQDGDALTGTLALTSGEFDRSGSPNADSTVGITVGGTLTDDTSQTLGISGRLEGDFLGSGHLALGGEFLGTVVSNGNSQNLDGGFIAER